MAPAPAPFPTNAPPIFSPNTAFGIKIFRCGAPLLLFAAETETRSEICWRTKCSCDRDEWNKLLCNILMQYENLSCDTRTQWRWLGDVHVSERLRAVVGWIDEIRVHADAATMRKFRERKIRLRQRQRSGDEVKRVEMVHIVATVPAVSERASVVKSFSRPIN